MLTKSQQRPAVPKSDKTDKSRPDKGKSGKDAQLVLRLDREDRDAFVALCKAQDTTASREVRRFIRHYLKAANHDR